MDFTSYSSSVYVTIVIKLKELTITQPRGRHDYFFPESIQFNDID